MPVRYRVGIKRVYEDPTQEDGMRILIDRLWPRGLSKEKAKVDLWLKDVAPSDGLRRWFGHKPERWEEFKMRYLRELEGKKETVNQLKTMCKEKKTTLLYAAKDENKNNGIVLRDLLSGR